MFERLLGGKPKQKPGARRAADGIDLDGSKIYIDDRIDPERMVATSQVFEDTAAEEAAARTTIAGGGAKVFALDLRPFFKAIGTKAGERSADTFTRFCENWLARAVGRGGAYEFDGAEFFFFRLDKPNEEAMNEALEIINEIGLQYLRGAFNPDLVPRALVPLEASDTMDLESGRIDKKAAFDALSQWREIHGPVLTEALIVAASHDRRVEKLTMVAIEAADRPAAARIQRGPDRRKKVRKLVNADLDRRKRKRGRRAADDPRNGASWV